MGFRKDQGKVLTDFNQKSGEDREYIWPTISGVKKVQPGQTEKPAPVSVPDISRKKVKKIKKKSLKKNFSETKIAQGMKKLLSGKALSGGMVKRTAEDKAAAKTGVAERTAAVPKPEAVKPAVTAPKPQKAAGIQKPQKAAGIQKPQKAAGIQKPQKAAGISKLQKAAGTPKPQKAAGIQKLQKAADISKPQKTSKVPKLQKAAGTLKKQKTAGIPESQRKTAGNLLKWKLTLPDEKKKFYIRAAVITVSAIYFLMVIIFSFHFLVRSYINEVKVSGLTADEAKAKMQELSDSYTLTVNDVDGTSEKIHDPDLNLALKDIGDVDTILSNQFKWLWPFAWAWQKNYSVTVDVSYNADVLAQDISRLSGLNTDKMTAPADAYAATDENGAYKVFPEVMGTTVDVDAATKAIETAVAAGQTEVNLTDFQIKPTVYSDNAGLAARVTQYNSYLLAAGSTFNFFDSVETLDASVIGSVLTDDGTSVTLDEKKVAVLMAKWREKHDTYGVSFDFTTHSGDTVKIQPGGDYGYELNEQDTGKMFIDVINSHTVSANDPKFYHRGISDKNNGLGSSYVEVSIEDQTLWVYKDGNVVIETSVVTGLPVTGRETYQGCYSIKAKAEKVTLGSLDVQGYASPVNYWVPFNGGEGLHDAPWRTDFGGDIYLTNGSHGCVNIPEENMGTVYANVEEDEAVVVY